MFVGRLSRLGVTAVLRNHGNARRSCLAVTQKTSSYHQTPYGRARHVADLCSSGIQVSEETLASLQEKGWGVIPGVVPDEVCLEMQRQIRGYVEGLLPDGKWPGQARSMLHSYRIGHLDAAWRARLYARHAFAQVYGTDKLLTSFDAIAVGRPPEDGASSFAEEGDQWLHLDQSARRLGLHCYQGGLYLETCDEDDWCFRAMDGSHHLHVPFFEEHDEGSRRADYSEFYRLTRKEIDWYASRGCEMKRVQVPRGGLLLWDSRTVHDNSPPLQGRLHPRWRFVVIVAMAPASWARPQDLALKKQAYDELLVTAHWPSHGVDCVPDSSAPDPTQVRVANILNKLPDVALSRDARLLAGIEEYDFDDGRPNGDPAPLFAEYKVETSKSGEKLWNIINAPPQ